MSQTNLVDTHATVILASTEVLKTRAVISEDMTVSFRKALPAVEAATAREQGRNWVMQVDGTNKDDAISLHVQGAQVKELRQLLQYAMNCRWEQLSDDMRALADVLAHGQPQPSHRDQLPN